MSLYIRNGRMIASGKDSYVNNKETKLSSMSISFLYNFVMRNVHLINVNEVNLAAQTLKQLRSVK